MEAEGQDVTISFDLWITLVGCTVPQIEEMTYAFDFHASLSGHAAYVDTKPEYWIKTIDDILSKRESVPGGTISQLQNTREHLLAVITPAYEAGRSAAKAVWDNAKSDAERESLMAAYDVPGTMAEAWRRVSDGMTISQANWFVEGYCYNWGQLGFDFQVSQL